MATILVLVGAAVAGVLAAVSLVFGDLERIDGYWTSAVVVDGANARVVEVIDYDFGVSDRHGIFRDVPGLPDNAAVQVSSPTAPDQFQLLRRSQPPRIRIGDPDRTIDGRHRYEIRYPIDVLFDEDGVETLSWNAVGTDWEVDISNIEIHIAVDRVVTDTRCSKGRFGSWGGCAVTQPEPGHLVVEVDGLDQGEGITVSGTLGDGLSALPEIPAAPSGVADDPGLGFFWTIATSALAALVGGLVATRLVRRAGRELVWAGGSADAAFGPQLGEDYPVRRVDHDDLDALASTEFAPPKELRAWQGGVLYAERVTDDHKVAWLLERAIDGDVEIEGTGKQLTLRRAGNGAEPEPVDHYRQAPLDRLFGGRSRVSLGSYDEQFSAAWSQLDDTLDGWSGESGLWDPAGDRRVRRALMAGPPVLVVSLVALIVAVVAAGRAGWVWWPLLALAAACAGAALAVLIQRWELRTRTPEGSGFWIRVESFRRFIEGSDAQHVDAAAKQGVLLDYTAWAVALDEVDRWTEAVEAAGVEGTLAPQALYLTAIASDLGGATTAAAVKPSSSGGGGGSFGGGSVGGGGGGGGGGSW